MNHHQKKKIKAQGSRLYTSFSPAQICLDIYNIEAVSVNYRLWKEKRHKMCVRDMVLVVFAINWNLCI